MEEHHLCILSQALRNACSPKPSPMKKMKPGIASTAYLRRSERFSSKPAPHYNEITFYERAQLPARKRDLSDRVRASDEARKYAVRKTEEIKSTLGSDYPTFVKSMLASHISTNDVMGLSLGFCKKELPRIGGVILLVGEPEKESRVTFLPQKNGLVGGWRKFSDPLITVW